MRCEKAKRQLALHCRGELSQRKAARLEKHLGTCPDCSKEIREYQAALAGVTAAARSEGRDWEEPEWKEVIARAISQDIPSRRPFFPRPKMAWAYGLAALLAVGAVALVTKNILQKPSPVLSNEILASTRAEEGREWILPGREFPRGLRDEPFLAKAISQEAPGEKPQIPGLSETKTSQDILSVTLVSQQTGLNVHWTFDKNFDWKEEKQ